MGQGTIRVTPLVLLEAIADTIDLDVLRRRLLLPEQYTLKSLSMHYSPAFGNEALISIEASDIPDDTLVSLYYRQEQGEAVELRRYTTTLQSVDVGQSTQ